MYRVFHQLGGTNLQWSFFFFDLDYFFERKAGLFAFFRPLELAVRGDKMKTSFFLFSNTRALSNLYYF